MQGNFTPRFLIVFTRLIGTEGGYVNSPNDPGGETKFGISKRAYPDVDIKNLTIEGAQQIYFTDFWDKLRLDQVVMGLDEFIFDFAVNSGVPTVARLLQRAVGVLPDGIIGPVTVNAIRSSSPVKVSRLLFVERAIIFAKAKENVFAENSHGWYARLFDQTKLMLDMFN
jgi:lysozyme family protein